MKRYGSKGIKIEYYPDSQDFLNKLQKINICPNLSISLKWGFGQKNAPSASWDHPGTLSPATLPPGDGEQPGLMAGAHFPN